MKIAISKTKFPNESILYHNHNDYDYADSFRGVLNDIENKFDLIIIGQTFFSVVPKWIRILFDLRNKIVSLFGLKTPGSVKELQSQHDKFKFEKGQRIGIFKVFDRTEREIILGENDKHLNFRISLFIEQQKNNSQKKDLTISSVVEFNNWFGRVYFLLVKPFHKLIVPSILKGVIKELEKRNIEC